MLSVDSFISCYIISLPSSIFINGSCFTAVSLSSYCLIFRRYISSLGLQISSLLSSRWESSSWKGHCGRKRSKSSRDWQCTLFWLACARMDSFYPYSNMKQLYVVTSNAGKAWVGESGYSSCGAFSFFFFFSSWSSLLSLCTSFPPMMYC